MNVSLNCFCDYLEAGTTSKQISVVKKYRKGSTAAVKGMNTYYSPSLRLIRRKLCPDGSVDAKLHSLREACVSSKWTERLIDIKIESNTRVFNAYRTEFGEKDLKVFTNPRLHFLACEDLAVNLSPELHSVVDGIPMMWKFGLSKKSRADSTVSAILHMLSAASAQKGFKIPIDQIRFLDTTNGRTFFETRADGKVLEELRRAANSLVTTWEQVA
jgi:hypothetical protein